MVLPKKLRDMRRLKERLDRIRKAQHNSPQKRLVKGTMKELKEKNIGIPPIAQRGEFNEQSRTPPNT